MGQEVVYCHRCLTRLLGGDFDTGKAFRTGDQISCAACTQEILASLPERERLDLQARIEAERHRRGSSARHPAARPDPSGITRSIPVPSAAKGPPGGRPSSHSIRVPPQASTSSIPVARRRRSALPVAAGAASVAVVLAVVVAVATGGRGGVPEDLPAPAPLPPPPAVAGATDAAARDAMARAREFRRSHPADFLGQLRSWEKAAWDVGNSPHLAEAKREIEDAKARLSAALAPQVAALDAQARGLAAKDDFAGAVDLLEQGKKRHDTPVWTAALDRKIQEMDDRAAERFKALKEEALAARRRGSASEAKSIRDRVEKWGYRKLTEDLDRSLAAVAAPPKPAPQPPRPPPDAGKPLSKEAEAYRAPWERAMLLAGARRFDEASSELERASRDLQEADVRGEARADLQSVGLVESACAQALKALSETSRNAVLNVEIVDDAGRRARVNDRVARVDLHRAELRKNRQIETYVVEFDDITGASLADLLGKRKRNPTEDDRRGLALLCLLDGDETGALAHLGDPAGRIPWKYWALAREARAKALKPDPKEREARRLFSAAEREWRSAATRGAAIEKYRTLRDAFGGSAAVRRYQTVVVRRCEEGKEWVIGPDEIRGSGQFRAAALGEDRFWTSTADAASDAAARENFVEFQFHALPGTQYRAWIYAGGCCQETFTAHFQATELTGPDPRKAGATVPYEPGGNVALPLKHGLSSLKKTHLLHAPAKEPKEPRKWEWIPIPLPRYGGPGAKRVRVLSEQQGFSVACAVVSAVRRDEPSEAETKDLLRARPDAPETTRPCRQPIEWLLAGPFDGSKGRGFATVHPPEEGIDPGARFATKAGPGTWTSAFAEIRPGGAAVFNLVPLFKPKDNVVAYALLHVKSPDAKEAKLLLGCDDGAKAWVNGALVHQKNAGTRLKVDEDAVPVKLKPGWNRILLKIVQGTGEWAVAARLTGADGKPLANLEYDAWGDLPRSRQ